MYLPNQVRWYYRLKESNKIGVERKSRPLFSDFKQSDIIVRNMFVVYRMDGEGRRYYAVFPNHVDFFQFYKSVESPYRAFHEVILGERPQKPRFDIDLTIDACMETHDHLTPEQISTMLQERGQEIFDLLVDGIIAVVRELTGSFDLTKNLFVCTSHGPQKYSCHVILSGFNHNNHLEAKEFFNLVARTNQTLRLAEKQGILDYSVYATLKSFRILGSVKQLTIGKPVRRKTFQPRFLYRGQWYEHVLDDIRVQNRSQNHQSQDLVNLCLFEESLIGHISGSINLPIIVEEKKITHTVNIPKEQLDKISGFLLKVAPGFKSVDDPGFPFQIDSVNGNFISLLRLQPFKCITCLRVHENENPFIYVRGDGCAFFSCRRSKQKTYLGRVDDVTVTPIGDPNPETDTDTMGDTSGEGEVVFGGQIFSVEEGKLIPTDVPLVQPQPVLVQSDVKPVQETMVDKAIFKKLKETIKKDIKNIDEFYPVTPSEIPVKRFEISHSADIPDPKYVLPIRAPVSPERPGTQPGESCEQGKNCVPIGAIGRNIQ